MLRIVLTTIGRLIVAGITAAVVLGPALVDAPASKSTHDPVTITRFSATFDVNADGSVHATEEIRANFPMRRHGIFRYWDLADAKDPKVRFTPKDITVERDGSAERFDLLWKQGRRYRVAKIGDPDRTLSKGDHVYRISYQIPGALSAEKANESRFEWQVVAAGWAMVMDEVDITVNLPAAPAQVACRIGDNTQCAPAQSDNVLDVDGSQIKITAENLQPNTPIRVAAILPMSAPEQVTRPWSIRWDRALGPSPIFLGLIVVLALIAGGVGYLMERKSRESHPGAPIVFGPPIGLSPVQTHYVMHERIPSNAFVATILQLAEQKVVTLEQNSAKDWTITSNADAAKWSELDPTANAVGAALGLIGVGKSFRADGSVESGKELSTLNSKISKATTEWAKANNFIVSAPAEAAAVLFGLLALPIGIVPLFFGAPMVWFLPFGAYWIGGLGLLRTGVGRRRTDRGRSVWAEGAGFERFLSTKSSRERYDFSANKDMYLEFIPYAVAFGVADAWADKYRAATNEEPPTPLWLGVQSSSFGAQQGVASLVSSFESSISSSISAYQATQSSSSGGGGGGGGFSGGGGGGGGGGSW